jgi:hypothetical protein
MKKIISQFILATLLLVIGNDAATAQNDSIRFSLMTCSPGPQVYELYGHTAIRYENLNTHEDWVFNYGMFNFNKPHFIYRFAKGETDYELGVMPYDIFIEEYKGRGSAVIQQTLNLRPDETLKLLQLLSDNYRPENRTYRYNYFYDNCTTRARDRIEEAIDGRVIYPFHINAAELDMLKKGKLNVIETTYRSITKQFTGGHPWAQFGNDMALGAEADRPIGARQQMFSPFYMMAFADSARIVGLDGSVRPLVAQKTLVVPMGDLHYTSEFPLSPMACACIFLVITVGISIYEYRKRRLLWGYSAFVYGVQGLAGCIIAFMFLFSSHPTVGSNWLIIIFNPIPLLCLPWILYSVFHHKKCIYHPLNLLVLALFMISFAFLPQQFSLVIVPLALILFVRSLSHLTWQRMNVLSDKKV